VRASRSRGEFYKNMKNRLDVNMISKGLDGYFGFAIIILVKPTAFSVRRDGGFFNHHE